MSAQQSMLGSLFDASCVCDDTGRISQQSPQMKQLLAPQNDLTGTPFASFTKHNEQRRVQRFVEIAWRTAFTRAATMQTTIRCAGVDQNDGIGLEAKIYCLRLPRPAIATESMSMWAHGGLFLGLQELNTCDETSGAYKANPSITFDAGSTNFQVLSSDSTCMCAGIFPGSHGLHDLLSDEAAQKLDDWVYNEVQQAPSDKPSKSKSTVRFLALHLPPCRERKLMFRKAWLEIPRMLGCDRAMPVTLKMSGMSLEDHTGRHLGLSTSGSARSQEWLTAVPECTEEALEDEEEEWVSEEDDGTGSCHDARSSTTSTIDSTVLAEDSISQCASVHLMPQQRRGSAVKMAPLL